MIVSKFLPKGLFIWARLTRLACSYWDEFHLGFTWEFHPSVQDEKRRKILGTGSYFKFKKQRAQTWWITKILTFAPIIALATLKAASLQLNGMLMMWKIQQTMQDDHPDCQSSCFHLSDWAEVFTWQNFQPTCRDPGWKNWDLGNRASLPSHMNT